MIITAENGEDAYDKGDGKPVIGSNGKDIIINIGEQRMKLIDIFKLEQSLNTVSQQETSYTTALALNKLFKYFELEIKVLNEKRIAILDKYTKDDKTDLLTAEKEFNELLQTEVNVNFEPIPSTVLQDLRMSAISLKGLMPFVVENNQ